MANRWLVAGGTGNWNSTTNWAATDGGASGASFPVAGDVVAANSNSGNANITVNVASACASFTASGTYAGTLTFDSTLSLTSTCDFNSPMTLAGTAGTLIVNGSSGLRSGGHTLTCAMTLQGSATYTLSDDWTVNGLFTVGTTTLTTTMNGFSISCNGGIRLNYTSGTTAGTTVLKMTGTGTLDAPAVTTGTLANFLEFAAGANTITVSGTIRYRLQTITYTSGTMVTAGSVLVITAAATLNTNGMTWGQIQPLAPVTITLTSDLQATDILFITNNTTFTGAFNITTATMTTSGASPGIVLSGNLTCAGLWSESSTTAFGQAGAFDITAGSCTISGTKTITLIRDIIITGLTTSSDANVINGAFNWQTGGLTTTGALTGTSTMLFSGTGTWTGAAGALSMNTTINTAGTLTLSGTILYSASGTKTLTYTAGTVAAGSSILSIASSCTLATNGMTWANVTLTAAQTLTLSSLLSVSGTFTFPNAAVTLAGAGNASVGTLTTAAISAARVYTLDSGNTYTINTAYTVTGLTGGHVSFVGSAASGTKANVVLAGGASQALIFVDATDIDSSAGQVVYSLGGTLTRTINWANSLSSVGGLKAVGYAA